MRHLLNALGGLQWKLTLSYTLVTFATVLVVMIAPIYFPIQFGGGSEQLSRLMALDVRLSANELTPFLAQHPPNREAVQVWVMRTTQPQDVIMTPAKKVTLKFEMASPAPEGALPAPVATPVAGSSITTLPQAFGVIGTQVRFYSSPLYLAVVDPQGNLLASSEDMTPGEPFPASRLPLAAEALNSALRGETDPTDLTQRDKANDILFVAAPILDEQSQVRGALVRGIPVPLTPTSVFLEVVRILLPRSPFVFLLVALVGTLFGYVTSRGMTRRLDRLSEAAHAWSQGDFGVQAQDRSTDEVGQLARQLNRMASQVQHLLQTREELAALEERHRLARDVHDSVKQQVFAISMNLGAAQALWRQQGEAARSRLDEAAMLARQAQQELTAIIQTLRPAALEEKGLDQAIWESARHWEKQTGIALADDVKISHPMPGDVEQALFRICQEALANIARHSQATAATLTLSATAGEARLVITDNGQGFDLKHAPPGMGLNSMRERVEALEGEFEIKSGGRGTRLSLTIPLRGVSP